MEIGTVPAREPASALQELASAIEAGAWELAVAAVEEGLNDDQVPSLQRLGRLGPLGDIPTFIPEPGRGVVEPRPDPPGPRRAPAPQAPRHAPGPQAPGVAPPASVGG